MGKYSDLYCSWEDSLTGILKNDDACKVMDTIVNVVSRLLESTMPISDDVLVLCWKYCLMIGNKEKCDKFLALLTTTVKDSLNPKSDTKARDGAWFKEFLLNSNVWLMKQHNNKNNNKKENKDDVKTDNNNNNEAKSDSPTKGLLYEEISDTANKQLEFVKEFIKDNVVREMKENSKEFDVLVKYEMKLDNKIELRQDAIEYGIQSDYKEKDLWIMASHIQNKNFDCFQEYNLKNYLTKMLVTAHAINDSFQDEMRRMFKRINKCAVFMPAPVKLEERCQIKVQTDYNEIRYPSASALLDCIRCSITFDSCSDLLRGVLEFKERIEKQENNDKYMIKKIVRCKNTFNKIESWINKNGEIDVNKCNYCDIKLNVIIVSSLSDDGSSNASISNKTAIIGEVQFLINWFLRAKAMSHSWYSILRRNEFVENVNGMLLDDCDLIKYQRKILGWINHENLESISKELLFNPNKILAMKYPITKTKTNITETISVEKKSGNSNSKDDTINVVSTSTAVQTMKTEDFNAESEWPKVPLLFKFGKTEWFRAFKLYFASILHFSKIINSSKNKRNFCERYINNEVALKQEHSFIWGINTSGEDKHGLRFKICQTVMKSPHFHGITVCLSDFCVFCVFWLELLTIEIQIKCVVVVLLFGNLVIWLLYRMKK